MNTKTAIYIINDALEQGTPKRVTINSFNGNMNVTYEDGTWNSWQMDVCGSYEDTHALKALIKDRMPKSCKIKIWTI